MKVRSLRLVSVALVVAGLIPFGCGKMQSEDRRSGEIDPALEAVETNAAVKSENRGVVQALLKTTSANTQIIKAAPSSAIAGAQLAFLPFSFDVDYDIALEEGRSIASRKNLTKLGFGTGTIIEAYGPAVVVSWTFDYDTERPFSITLPIPPPAAAALQDVSTSAIAVLFLKNVEESESNKLGLISAKKFAVSGSTLTFKSSSSGVYQVVRLNQATPIVEPEEVTTEELVKTVVPPPAPAPGVAPGPGTSPNPAGPVNPSDPEPPVEPATAPPSEFVMIDPVDPARVYGIATKVRWERAEGADVYEVRIDATDPTCAASTAVYADNTGTSVIVQPLQNGVNYVCIIAKNAVGATAATNYGIAFNADIEAPPKPNPPRGSGATPVSQVARWEWDAGSDIGPSGFRNFEFEVGTSVGGGDILSTTTSAKTDNHPASGKTSYYGRIRLFDRAGNASEWSDTSEPLKANL